MLKHVGDIQDRVGRTIKQTGRNGMCGPTANPKRAGAARGTANGSRR